MKHNSDVFLPFAIDMWAGIDNWLSGNREGMQLRKRKYLPDYNTSHVQRILHVLKERFARSGKFPVVVANELLWAACLRYSGAPERSFEAGKLDGLGMVVRNRYGCVDCSVPLYDVVASWDKGLCSVAPYSLLKTRRVPLWDQWATCAQEAAEAGIAYSSTDAAPKPPVCRFCGQSVSTRKFRRHHSEPHCQRRECRHMAWLAHTPQSRGGIELTPRQRKATPVPFFDQVRVVNYLTMKAAEAKRSAECRI